MKKAYFPAILFIIFLFHSCLSFYQDDSVIEKSELHTPSWISQNGEISKEDPQLIKIVFKKTDVYNLTLGIKQAQASASRKISSLMFDQIKLSLFERAQSLNKNKPILNNQTLYFAINKSVQHSMQNLKITSTMAEEVYWEHRQRQHRAVDGQYYVIWVLHLVPKTVYDSAVLAVAHELQRENDNEIVTLANDILRQYQGR